MVIEKKIEEMCKSYSKENLVGFVDREFRNFEMQDSIIDQVQGHYQDGNLVWSRGHSVENYYFDPEIFRGPFQDVCGEDFRKAFPLFRKYISSYLKVVCVLSLLGLKNNNQTERIRASVGWNIVASNGELDIETWKTILSSHLGLDDEEITSLTGYLPDLLDLVSRADIEIIKWLSHGHLGFSFLWNAFARCIYDSFDGEENIKRKKANSFLNLQNNIRFNMCGRSWAKAAVNGKAEFPTPVFELLGIDI